MRACIRASDHVRSQSDRVRHTFSSASHPWSCTSRLRHIIAHPHCHTNDPFPFVTRFPSSSHYADRPSPSFHAARLALGLSQVGIGLDHLFHVRKGFYFAFCTFSSISFASDLLPALFQDSLFHFGPFATVFRTPYLLHPCYLYIHRSALDHISVNLSLFRAPHSLSIVASKPAFTFLTLPPLRFSCLYFTLDSGFVKRHLRPLPPVSPLTLRSSTLPPNCSTTKPPCCRSSVTYCCCLVTLYR